MLLRLSFVHRLAIATLFLLCCISLARSADPLSDQEKAKLLLAQRNLRASRQAIRTLEIVLTIDYRKYNSLRPRSSPTEVPKKFKVIWNQDNSRIRYTEEALYGEHPVEQEASFQDGEWTILTTEPEIISGRIVPERVNFLPTGNPWLYSLFALPSERWDAWTDEAITNASMVKDIRSQRANGRMYQVIEMTTDDGGAWELWLDPSQNYVVKKTIRYPDAKSDLMRIERTVTSYREFAGGIYFPTGLVQQTIIGGRVHSVIRVSFSEVNINRTIQDDSLQEVKLPQGTLVLDESRGTRYLAGPGGTPAGEERSIKQTYDARMAASGAEGVPCYLRWWFVLGVGLVVAVLAVFGYLRFWTRAASSK